ncbi:MAG: hypothetical protein RL141_211 [Candidatus Parcubacteria bacterium]|jgi:hypothetical protein
MSNQLLTTSNSIPVFTYASTSGIKNPQPENFRFVKSGKLLKIETAITERERVEVPKDEEQSFYKSLRGGKPIGV